jgi:hypothetical protein
MRKFLGAHFRRPYLGLLALAAIGLNLLALSLALKNAQYTLVVLPIVGLVLGILGTLSSMKWSINGSTKTGS